MEIKRLCVNVKLNKNNGTFLEVCSHVFLLFLLHVRWVQKRASKVQF